MTTNGTNLRDGSRIARALVPPSARWSSAVRPPSGAGIGTLFGCFRRRQARERVRWLCALAFFATSFAKGSSALAGDASAESRWRLDYRASDATCPDAVRVQALVVARLGFDPFAASRPSPPEASAEALRIVIDRGSSGEGLDAHVSRLEGEAVVGERTLHHADCAELTAAAALAGSILVDPTGELAKRQEPRTASAPPAGVTAADDPWRAPKSEPRPVALPPPPPATVLEVAVGARFVASAGVAPAPSFGVSIDGSLRRGRFVFRAEARADFAVGATPLADGAAVATTLNQASVLPCVAIDPLVLCGVLSMGAMVAESDNLVPKERDTTFYGAAGLRPMLDLPIAGQLHFVAGLEGVLAFRRITVSVRKIEVWTSPPASAAASFGLALKFL